MRKLWTFSLLGMFSLCITAVAEAKVCFLPNVLIGGKCVSLSKAKYNDCKGFTETVNCETVGKAVIDTCTTEDGKTYYKCGCRGDVISWEVIKEHPGWLCEDGYDDGCGCSAEHIFCSSEYKYRGDGTGKCAKSDENENSRGVGACALPNGRVYYKDCNCNGYPYECDGLTGLKAPTGVNEETAGCKSPHSLNYKYKECECADGWTSGSCESNTNGCLMPISYVTANDGELTCALCDERICKSNGESNLEAVYCAPKNENGKNTFGGEYLTSTITDCVDLGFVQGATGGFCPAGTQKAGEVGVKCPFNGNYMFCEDQTGCYPTQEACEYDISVKTCQDIGGCYRVAECNQGYELNKNKTACVVAECAEGFTTEPLNCKGAEYGLMHGYNGEEYQEGKSGAKECKQCECDIAAARAAGYCKYTNNPADTDETAAGEGILSVPCCDGSYSECRFDKGTATPSEGTATHEKHEACGQTYYVATSCLEGYELINGKCEGQSCATGYTTTVQSVNDCADSSKLYGGAMGWSIKAQEANGKVVQSGGKTCYQCSCDASDCKWNSSNKGRFGLLPEETACCDGSNKSCVVNRCRGAGTDDLTDDNDLTNDCIPDSASIALCDAMPKHAVSMKKYEACSQQARCLVRECEQDYRPSDDGQSCVFNGTCDSAQGLILNAAGSDCECGNGWSTNSENACTTQGLTYKDSDTCTKNGSFYTIRHNNDGSCHKVDTSSFTCDDKHVKSGNKCVCQSRFAYLYGNVAHGQATGNVCVDDAGSHYDNFTCNYRYILQDNACVCDKKEGYFAESELPQGVSCSGPLGDSDCWQCEGKYVENCPEGTLAKSQCSTNAGAVTCKGETGYYTTSGKCMNVVSCSDYNENYTNGGHFNCTHPDQSHWSCSPVNVYQYHITEANRCAFVSCQNGYRKSGNGSSATCTLISCSEQDSNLVSANDEKVSNINYKCTDDTEGRTDAYGTCKKCIGKKTCYTEVPDAKVSSTCLTYQQTGKKDNCPCIPRGIVVKVVTGGNLLNPTTKEICGLLNHYFDKIPPNCYVKDVSIVKPVDPITPPGGDIPAVGIK